mmetsp:Transcript_555/g.1171  ORF Transcript_555/g.1171 Transcript_555/m.1171 type:complete len:492 (+) Transcript_555:64-1539(+)
MSASKKPRCLGLLASAILLVILLVIATFFLTEHASWQLRSMNENRYETLVKSVPLAYHSTVSLRSKSKNQIDDYGVRSSVDHGDGLKNDSDDVFDGDLDKDDEIIRKMEHEISGNILDEEYELDSDGGDDDAYDYDDNGHDDDDDDVDDGNDNAENDYEGDNQILARLFKNNSTNINNEEKAASPACHPHFKLALPNNQWNDKTKFRRIYFYHARKAGGSSMHKYLGKVAKQYGLELKAREWGEMEEPSTNAEDGATFYVTHLREPVDRAISHFKYQGRWNCHDLVFHQNNKGWEPTIENAKNLETWNQTGGHKPIQCKHKRSKGTYFFLSTCAVNCYTQWFSGLSCPNWKVPVDQQYQVAKSRVLKYNLIVVIEKLRDPNYVQAVEDFFGVTGLTEKGKPFCEKQSHEANQQFPLIVRNDTREKLTSLNQVDIKLYQELSSCLMERDGTYNFPKWDPDRFALHTFNETEAKIKAKAAKEKKMKKKNKRKG